MAGLERVAFVGLGIMGGPMARNLREAGFELSVYTRTREKAERFAAEHDLLLISIADLIAYRRRSEKLVHRVTEARIPTAYGSFNAVAYESHDGRTHVALVKGEPAGHNAVLVRVHSECFTGDVLGSFRCDCGLQLAEAMRRISDEASVSSLFD